MAARNISIPCEVGVWTQVAQQMAYRTTLIVAVQGAAGVLSMAQPVPSILTLDGTVPPGIFIGTSVSGFDSGEKRMQLPNDGDLVTQEWYVWITSVQVQPPPQTWVSDSQLSTDTYNIVLPAVSGGIVVLFEAGIFGMAMGGFNNVVTSGTGTPNSAPGANFSANGADAYPTFWYWEADPLGEIITVTNADVGDFLYTYTVIPAELPIGGFVASAASPAWGTIDAPILTADDDLIDVMCVLSAALTVDFGLAEAGILAAGDQGIPAGATFVQGGFTTWSIQSVSGLVPTAGTAVQNEWNQVPGPVPTNGCCVGAVFPSPVAGSVDVSVFEAFDDEKNTDVGSFNVRLPQLSPHAKAHLEELRRRLKEDPHAR